MSEKEKDQLPVTEESQPVAEAEESSETESTAAKVKKWFRVESPYADYAADNDKVSEMMYESVDEPPKPTAKDLLRTVLAAAALVFLFIGVALLFSLAGNCLGMNK